MSSLESRTRNLPWSGTAVYEMLTKREPERVKPRDVFEPLALPRGDLFQLVLGRRLGIGPVECEGTVVRQLNFSIQSDGVGNRRAARVARQQL